MAINEPVYLCDKKEFTTCLVTRGCEEDAYRAAWSSGVPAMYPIYWQRVSPKIRITAACALPGLHPRPCLHMCGRGLGEFAMFLLLSSMGLRRETARSLRIPCRQWHGTPVL